jgi:hypothetical protein
VSSGKFEGRYKAWQVHQEENIWRSCSSVPEWFVSSGQVGGRDKADLHQDESISGGLARVYLSGLCPRGSLKGEIRHGRSTRTRVSGGLVRVYLSGLCPLGRWEGEIRQVLTRKRVHGGSVPEWFVSSGQVGGRDKAGPHQE